LNKRNRELIRERESFRERTFTVISFSGVQTFEPLEIFHEGGGGGVNWVGEVLQDRRGRGRGKYLYKCMF